jgi:hypothetical protein
VSFQPFDQLHRLCMACCFYPPTLTFFKSCFVPCYRHASGNQHHIGLEPWNEDDGCCRQGVHTPFIWHTSFGNVMLLKAYRNKQELCALACASYCSVLRRTMSTLSSKQIQVLCQACFGNSRCMSMMFSFTASRYSDPVCASL